MLELKDVSLSFGALEVLRGASLTLGQGERIAITGPSGCGKTSLLHVIAGLLHPDSGLVRNRAARTGCVFQEPRLLPWLSAEENVSIVIPHGTQGQDALMLLKELGLSDSAEKHPCELSGGMQQRAGIAAAMLLEPCVLLADEPTSALDVTVQKQVLEALRSACRTCGTAMVLVTHNIGVIGAMADRVLVMQNGAAVEYGRTQEILREPQTEYTRALLSAVPRLRRS